MRHIRCKRKTRPHTRVHPDGECEFCPVSAGQTGNYPSCPGHKNARFIFKEPNALVYVGGRYMDLYEMLRETTSKVMMGEDVYVCYHIDREAEIPIIFSDFAAERYPGLIIIRGCEAHV